MPQCVSKMVKVSNLYLQRGAAKILNKALLKFGCKTITKWRCWLGLGLNFTGVECQCSVANACCVSNQA